MSVQQRVTQVIARQLGVEESRVLPSAAFREDLAADSLDILEVVMALEEEFGVDLGNDIGETLNTVQDAIDLIGARLSRAPA